jgi:hypothetical protein
MFENRALGLGERKWLESEDCKLKNLVIYMFHLGVDAKMIL